MDARTPPKIRLEDLDRDELLKVVSWHAFYISQRDLLRARWEAALDRSAKADAAATLAREAYRTIVDQDRKQRTRRAIAAQMRARTDAYSTYEAASRRAGRAYRAQERAYKALNACPAGA